MIQKISETKTGSLGEKKASGKTEDVKRENKQITIIRNDTGISPQIQ